MNNLAKRTISGIGLVIIMLACLLLNRFLFAALMLFIMTVMMAEFFRMTMGESHRSSRFIIISAGCILFALLFCTCAFKLPAKYITLSIIPLLVAMAGSLYIKDKTEYGKLSFLFTGFLYVAAPLSLSNLLVFRDGEFNAVLILCFFVIIWCSDIGAYLIGCALGKNGKKLFPSVSPNKSWVGFWGGMAFAVLASCILSWSGLMSIPIVHCFVLAVLMHVTGVFGDLYESQWKRHCGVKDSGNIIPGHGGLLDRFDSALFAMPVGAVYLALSNLL